MAKKVKGLSRGIDALIDSVKKNLLSPEARDMLAEQVAREAASLIRRRTRRGLGVREEGGASSPLKPLSRSYVEQRKRMRLSAFTSPGKSNLTRSSELLESLGVQRTETGRYRITPQGYRDVGGLSNAQLASYVSRARPFLYLAKDEIAQLAKGYRKSVEDLVKRKVK
jgi:hypothetical protein